MVEKTWLATSFLGLFTLASACDESSSPGPGDEDRRFVHAIGGGWGCKDCDFRNSPWLGTFAVDRLAFGGYDKEDLPYLGYILDPAGIAWPVEVDDEGLVANVNGTPTRAGALVGWTLVIKAPGEEPIELDIHAYQDVPDWTDAANPVPTYGLSYFDPSGDAQVNLCPGLNMDDTSVVFLNGETYDLAQPGSGAATGVQDVATLACRGHALAKMKLLGYDPSSPHATTTAEDRVATLRMVTADYCGDGTSHTQFGIPLDWTDALGHVGFDPASMSPVVEAEWTAEGAHCLNLPRIPGTQVGCPGPLPACMPTFEGHGGAAWTSMVK